MTIYERFLQYYITSNNYFIDTADWFWELKNQVGECGAEDYPFESKLYQDYKSKLQTDRGYYFLFLNDQLVQDYFSTIECEDVLFAVIYAHWWGLNLNQIHCIRKKTNGERAWETLINYLITLENIYHIQTEIGEKTAVKKGAVLIADDSTEYEIN